MAALNIIIGHVDHGKSTWYDYLKTLVTSNNVIDKNEKMASDAGGGFGLAT